MGCITCGNKGWYFSPIDGLELPCLDCADEIVKKAATSTREPRKKPNPLALTVGKGSEVNMYPVPSTRNTGRGARAEISKQIARHRRR